MKTVLKLLGFASILILIATGCQKISDEPSFKVNAEFDAAFVKEWYYGTFKKSSEWFSSSEHGKKIPDWSNGVHRKVGRLEIIEFPLRKVNTSISVLSKNSLSSSERKRIADASLTRISFIQTENGEILVRELDYIPDLPYLKTKNYDISDLKLGNLDNKFTGRIITRKWNGDILSIRKFSQGRNMGKVSVQPTSQNNIKTCESVTYCMEVAHCLGYHQGDVLVITSCSEWETTNECWDELVCTETPDECDYNSNESCECQMYGIGCGGGGGENEPPIITVDSVTNEITQPCLQNAFDAITSDKMKNELSKLYQQTFVGNNNVHNLLIGEVSDIYPNHGLAASHVDPNNPHLWIIDLNSGYDHLFTQELWGSVILHEMVHGFILKNNLNFSQTIGFSTSHEIMLDRWIIQLKDAMKDIFGLTDIDALALSLEGFDDILKDDVSGQFRDDMKTWMQTKYNVDINQMAQIADAFTTQVKGTPCQ